MFTLDNCDVSLIFKCLCNSHDYPDLASGGVVRILLPNQQEVFLQIISTIVPAVNELKLYPVEKINYCCRFFNKNNPIDLYSATLHIYL